ncbi:MAG: BREX-2 system phosphatase PglZ, partial [Pseudonocardiaceae bacterium]
GVLTRDHALGAVAQHHLHCGVSGGVTGAEMDAVAVLRWSTEPGSAARLADLREAGGDTLTDELLGWLATRCGAAAGPVLALLRAGRLPDLVPLGVVVGVIVDEGVRRAGDLDRVSADARIRLESRLGGVSPGRPELIGWGRDAATVAGELLLDPQTLGAGELVIARADALLVDLRAEALAEASELLRSGLTERLVRLATALRCGLNAAVPHDVDASWVQPEDGAAIEAAWDAVAGHRLGDLDHRVPVFRAAVRLARWLATPAASASSLTGLIGRHRDADAWVDSAINHASVGVGDPDLGRALGAVLEAARRRRDSHDRTFAEALAGHTASQDPDPAVRHLENLLPEVVLPLTRHTPVLLLVMDGMSVGVATEVMASALSNGAQGWVEALLPAADRRAAALAVFPTLTEISRASLLSGTLVTGAQSQEHRGFSAVVRAAGLTGRLFHKKPLDVSQPGFAVADDVGAAIDDVEGTRLVACVLNTIDDALDRSDPAGTAWGVDAVKHLAPLLERAGRTGRTVVLTADHGHVVERRAGTQRCYPDISSSRSRAAGTAGEGEVLVAGPRVLAHGGRAVLAVDERLRYGPLKAGYHGGASPAEAVVPVCVLVPGDVPEGSDLVLAAPQEPAWWSGPVRAGGSTAMRQPLTLFDEPVAEPSAGAGLAAMVLRSRSFARQRALAGRGMIMEHLESLLAALLDAPDRRLAPAAAAATAGIPVSRLRGAVAQAQRLLNVEG